MRPSQTEGDIGGGGEDYFVGGLGVGGSVVGGSTAIDKFALETVALVGGSLGG